MATALAESTGTGGPMSVRTPEPYAGAGPVTERPGPYSSEARLPSAPPPAKPFWFGTTERPLFGWYHAPNERPARAAVVLCNAFGHEAMVSHRSYRRLAQRLAAEGFAVLRFDYDGTGDSAGEDSDPNRVDAWLDSIRRACSEAIALSGAEHTILFGMWLGALLALAQAERAPVDGLMLLAPPRSGRAWLREMRALQAIKGARSELDSDLSNDPGIAGFLLDHSTRADLERLDAAKVRTCSGTQSPHHGARRSARRRGDFGRPARTPRAGSRALHHARICREHARGSIQIGGSRPAIRRHRRVAQEALRAHRRSRGAPAPSRSAPTSSRPSFTTMSAPTPLTRERAVDLGGLFGILSERWRCRAHRHARPFYS